LLAHRADQIIRVLIEGVGEFLELLECDRRRLDVPTSILLRADEVIE
jgi:hypothetical protein